MEESPAVSVEEPDFCTLGVDNVCGCGVRVMGVDSAYMGDPVLFLGVNRVLLLCQSERVLRVDIVCGCGVQCTNLRLDRCVWVLG